MTRLINAVGVVDINKADEEDKRISWKIAEGRKSKIAMSEGGACGPLNGISNGIAVLKLMGEPRARRSKRSQN